ncbi:zinc finger protein AEBP2 isoform X1 [Clupea harengus]|uniref:Zinc finger protein AEBP2 isoform X1 n=1 Tax=Clupea harengus TaxID=7950 RepID=A0A6P3VR06_CLUHA|nr:zinc finger protein AEBP2 isoform X1 [Clupea harengus]
MATTSTDGTDQESSTPSDQNPTLETEKSEEKAEGLVSEQEPVGNETVKMDVNDGQEGATEEDEKPSPVPEVCPETTPTAVITKEESDVVNYMDCDLTESGKSPEQRSSASCNGTGDGTGEPKQEQREENVSSPSDCMKSKADDCTDKTDHGIKRRASVEMSSSDGEPLSRMDSEDSISSTLMDLESTASSGRSTPAMMNGHGGTVAPATKGASSYPCHWDECHMLYSTSPDLAEHIRGVHVDGQRGGVFVCLWKGCKVYNTPSTSQSWLQRHMLSHSGDKPFKCVVGGCNATFASQGGLARHVPTHFSQQNSSKMSSHSKVKEESPSKAGINKRRKLKNKRRRSLLCLLPAARPHDFFDAQTMDAIRHRAICLNLATHIESQGNGHSVVFHSTVIARRKEDSGKVKILLHWTPEDILPDVWVNESDRPQLKTKVVHLSQLPQDTAVLLDPNIYRMFF